VNKVTIFFSNKGSCTYIALFFPPMSVLPYDFFFALLHHHQACSVWSDVNIELVLFQESNGKITSFLDPRVIQGLGRNG
jgi:hypothetical protein